MFYKIDFRDIINWYTHYIDYTTFQIKGKRKNMSKDPITFAVIHNGLKAIVDEMNLALFRSAFSPVITEGRDIGGAVFNAEGNLVAQGQWDLAVFVGLLEYSLNAIVNRYKGDIHNGDVFIMNDPFVGGTHFNDVGIVRPIFSKDKLMAFVAVCGHWADVGGQEPGSLVANAREHFQEGVRIPPIKLIMAGKPNTAIYDLISSNMRIPRDRLADLRAQVGATAVGETRLLDMVNKFGATAIIDAMNDSISYSEKLLREEIRKIPDGEYEGDDYVDMESIERPYPKHIHVKLTVSGDQMKFDFTGSDPESLSSTNSTLSSTASAVLVTVKSLFPEIPINHGCFKPIELIAPEHTVVNAKPPRAISSMAATVYEKVVGACQAALAIAIPQQAVGCQYNLINLTLGGDYNEKQYVAYLYSEGGFGGRATKDGPAGLVSLFGGGAKITPVEVFERRYPMEFEEWALWPDSGGPGKFRGGVGSRKTFRITEGEARLSCLGDREFYPPFGILGGKSGGNHGLIKNEGCPDETNLTLKASGVQLKSGDKVTIKAGGGGGYGDPLERDPLLVQSDVLLGFVSHEKAQSEYGVIVSSNGELDLTSTKKLRDTLKQNLNR